ncbi:MAG: hypothetical protein ABII27_03185 [bacterium]
MGLTIGFTYDAKEDYALGIQDNPDKFAEFDEPLTIHEINSALESGGHTIIKIGHAKNLIKRLVAGEKYDIVFNIAEGITGRGREGQVPSILELYDQPYVGSDPVTMGLTLDKVLAKEIARYHGILTPNYFVAKQNVPFINPGIKFPAFVKTSCEGTSKGVTKDSLVKDEGAMVSYIKYIQGKYKQNALVEEFVVGQEYTVVVLGNESLEALPPVQVRINEKGDLGEDFYTYDRVFNKEVSYVCPSDLDPKLEQQLKNSAINVVKALGCRDFSRVDFRVDKNNQAYFLECNPLPNLGSGDVFPIVAVKIGSNYNKIILRVLDNAVQRYNLAIKV